MRVAGLSWASVQVDGPAQGRWAAEEFWPARVFVTVAPSPRIAPFRWPRSSLERRADIEWVTRLPWPCAKVEARTGLLWVATGGRSSPSFSRDVVQAAHAAFGDDIGRRAMAFGVEHAGTGQFFLPLGAQQMLIDAHGAPRHPAAVRQTHPLGQ